MMLVTNQISGWMQRVAAKLADQADDFDGAEKVAQNNVVDQFKYIAMQVSYQLRQLMLDREESGLGLDSNAMKDELMSEFANKEYVTKNIRVMPIVLGQNENQSDFNSKHHMSAVKDDDSEAEEQKVNYEINHEMMETRQKVKERKKIEDEKRMKEEASDNKHAKRNKK